MRIAVVHDWLVTYAGAEKALEQILHLYPEADLFSLIDFLPADQRGFILNKTATTSFIQSLPFARKKYRSYLPLMPLAIEQLDLSQYDLVISSSYAVAKGVLTHSRQLHVCYCYSPMRYVWDLHHQYLQETGLHRGLRGMAARALLHYVRLWDATTAARPDAYLAISQYIRRRIAKVYGRDAAVVYPPVDTDYFRPGAASGDYYVTLSRLVPYKRVDLIVEAFSRMPERRLAVIGDGPDRAKVRAKAGRNVTLLGHQSREEVRAHLQKARAFVYAADEDFGIATVEAQACGTPVIAFGQGGSLETVRDGETGVLFPEQTVESVCEAVRRFEDSRGSFAPDRIRAHAERFGIERFRSEFKRHVDEALAHAASR
jgi:glycosyltransferase involved in cell wall biosynthesis